MTLTYFRFPRIAPLNTCFFSYLEIGLHSRRSKTLDTLRNLTLANKALEVFFSLLVSSVAFVVECQGQVIPKTVKMGPKR